MESLLACTKSLASLVFRLVGYAIYKRRHNECQVFMSE